MTVYSNDGFLFFLYETSSDLRNIILKLLLNDGYVLNVVNKTL